jgi:hypothetical protein
MRTTRSVSYMALAVSLLPASGCAGRHAATNTFHEPTMDFSLVHTVAVLPFSNLTPTQTAADRVRGVFVTMLQAQGGEMYVLPLGEVQKGLSRTEIQRADQPSAEDVVVLGKALSADAVITGSVMEYGEARSGSASANYVSVSAQMLETKTGRLVWSAQSTKGGVTAADRMFGGGGQPMNVITADAVNELLDKLFKAK